MDIITNSISCNCFLTVYELYFLDLNIPYHTFDYVSILKLIIFLLLAQIISSVYRLIIFLYYAIMYNEMEVCLYMEEIQKPKKNISDIVRKLLNSNDYFVLFV